MSFTIFRPVDTELKNASNIINNLPNGWSDCDTHENPLVRLTVAAMDAGFAEEYNESIQKLIDIHNECVDKGLLKEAAIVNVEASEDVYEATNSGFSNWMENPKVELSKEALFFRSSMTGDIFVNNETGQKYLVLMMGFLEL